VVIAFRGSSSPQDFLQDAKFDMEPLAYLRHNSAQPCTVQVHRGFLEDFDALNVAVVNQVRRSLATFERVSPHPKIYITGHSLGGALAILCALEFSRQKLSPAAVITFGQPRVGNATFRDLYNAALGDITHHVVNADDPIPLTPPLLFGYRDEGNEVFLPRAHHAVINPSIGFEIVSDVLGALASWRKRKLAFIPNHLMKAYLAHFA
jgi:triacylglycerol lipase